VASLIIILRARSSTENSLRKHFSIDPSSYMLQPGLEIQEYIENAGNAHRSDLSFCSTDF